MLRLLVAAAVFAWAGSASAEAVTLNCTGQEVIEDPDHVPDEADEGAEVFKAPFVFKLTVDDAEESVSVDGQPADVRALNKDQISFTRPAAGVIIGADRTYRLDRRTGVLTARNITGICKAY